MSTECPIRKKKRHRVLQLAVLLVFAGRLAGAATNTVTLDLETAIEQAIRFNLRLARAALAVDRARLDVAEAEADYALRLTPRGAVDVSETRGQWRAGMDVARVFDSGAQVTAGVLARHSEPRAADASWRTGIRVDISQPLFSQFGTQVHRERRIQASEQVRRERRLWEQAKAELILDLVQTFEELHALERQIQSDEAFYLRTDRLYRLTRAREEQGRSTRVDTLRVDLQRGQARARLENNRQRHYTRSRDLAELVGLPQETTLELVPPPRPDLDLPTPGEALELAFENRLDYAQALDDLRKSTRQIHLAERRLWPDIQFVAALEQFGEDASFHRAASMDEHTWLVGFTGDTDLLKRRERNALARTRLDEQSAREQLEIRRNAITREVFQRLSLYRRARDEAAIQQRNLHLAEQRVRLAQRLYEVGRGDNFAVTDAEDALLKAETALLSARAHWMLASYSLLHSLGLLLEPPEDLTPREWFHDGS